jgi:Tfp pilus assembly protein PilX
MRKNQTKFKSKRKQGGVALAIGIILLLIISVIGVNSMKSALLQEKMAGGLMNRNYADSAAYTLLINVEHYLYTAFQRNNGSSDICAPYCGSDPRSDEWHEFSTQKNMTGGITYPGPTNPLTALLPYLHDEPRFMMIDTSLNATGTNTSAGGSANFGTTAGELDNGSAGGTAGSSGSSGSSRSTPMKTYRITSKANDKTGNYYVIYESIYAVVIN